MVFETWWTSYRWDGYSQHWVEIDLLAWVFRPIFIVLAIEPPRRASDNVFPAHKPALICFE